MANELGVGITKTGIGTRGQVYNATGDIYLIDGGYIKRYDEYGNLQATSVLSGLGSDSRIEINQINGDIWTFNGTSVYRLDTTALTTSVTITASGAVQSIAVDNYARSATYIAGNICVSSDDGPTYNNVYIESFLRAGGAALFTTTKTIAGSDQYYARQLKINQADGSIYYTYWVYNTVSFAETSIMRKCNYDGSSDSLQNDNGYNANPLDFVIDTYGYLYSLTSDYKFKKSIDEGATWSTLQSLGASDGGIAFDEDNDSIWILQTNGTITEYDRSGTPLKNGDADGSFGAYANNNASTVFWGNYFSIRVNQSYENYAICGDDSDDVNFIMEGKHIHVHVMGTAISPYDTWQTAIGNLQDAVSFVTCSRDTIHVSDFTITIPDDIQIHFDTNGDGSGEAFPTTWKGGYANVGEYTDYSDTPQTTLSAIYGSSIVGVGTKDDGLFSTYTNGLYKHSFERLYIWNYGSSTISGSNTASRTSWFELINCIIEDRSSTFYTRNTGSRLDCMNCTFISYDSVGRFLYNDTNPSLNLTIRNCIFFGYTELTKNSTSSSDITYSTFFNITPSVPAGTGNNDDDPLFINQSISDFKLTPYTSPCIATGDPSDDFTDEPQPNGGVINRGAYGGTNLAAYANHLTDWYVSSGGSDTPPYDTWAKAANDPMDALDHIKLAATQDFNFNIESEALGMVSATNIPYSMTVIPRDTIFKPTIQNFSVSFASTVPYPDFSISNCLLDGAININCRGSVDITYCDAINSEEATITVTNSSGATIEHVACYKSGSNLITLDTCLFVVNHCLMNLTGAYIAFRAIGGSYGNIYNCIFYGDGNAGNTFISSEALSSVFESYNCYYNSSSSINKSAEVSGGTVSGGTGDIESDPILVDVTAFIVTDAHLDTGSPCLDAGTGDYSNERNPNGERANIGRYGNTPESLQSIDGDIIVADCISGQLLFATDNDGIIVTLDSNGWNTGSSSPTSGCATIKCSLDSDLGFYKFEKVSEAGSLTPIGYIALDKS